VIRNLLVANRGEIAVRVMRTAAEMGIATVAVASVDDQHSLHMARADSARILRGRGPPAYLDIEQIVAAAVDAGCDAIHPGYGFLSESAAFARACAKAGIAFVGPLPEHLELLGDKAQARALAIRCDVPVLAGTTSAVSLDEARAFMRSLGRPVMLKALSGGGGRGIRLVSSEQDLEGAYERCQSEALRSFGDGRVYVEQALMKARHIEVQILGDGSGNVAALGERDCTLQRRNQKLIEIAPSPSLTATLRDRLIAAAKRMAAEINYLNAGTFEFLVEEGGSERQFYFLEANPRLQVEHTVTEQVWQVDLVHAQLSIAAGAKLATLALPTAPRRGYSLQARINMERLLADGAPVMDGGTIALFEPASGPGVRVDTFGCTGYATSVAFDSLLAKLIVDSAADAFDAVVAKARRTLAEFAVKGVPTNRNFLRALLAHPAVAKNDVTTRFVDERLAELLAAASELSQAEEVIAIGEPSSAASPGVRAAAPQAQLEEGVAAIVSPSAAMVIGVLVEPGEAVVEGQPVAIVEAMKMEHVVGASASGIVLEILTEKGATLAAGQTIATLSITDVGPTAKTEATSVDLDAIRPDLGELIARQQGTQDVARPDAVAKRHAKGARTARENVAALCDAGSFVEYGSLVVAGQRQRRPMDELIRRTPADGCIVGFGSVNGALFPREVAQSLVVVFDETVLAGTMGEMAREKLRHVLVVAHQARRPVILFAEGGGGRAGDTDLHVAVTGWTLDIASYFHLSQISGLAPLVGVTSGLCFAANAGMLSCCDVIIATKDANIGVGGPSMIEGGRLGRFTPQEIGPMDVQTANGVVDLLVDDEEAAARAAKQYLSYFQGAVSTWTAHDQRATRFVVPENRLRAYDVRKAVTQIADVDSVMELRQHFGVTIITALARVEGRPIGIVANNPLHLGGAIDSDGADKASRFMRLCEAFGLPILMLCDTPGMMVGPEAEKTATVRKMGRLFVTGANLTVPFFTIVLRKAYGIGGILMAGGWFKAPRFVVSWPTGEFGGMNIEGNVKLAHAAELAAIADPEARRARFEALVAEMHKTGRALAVATHFEVDNVIDPADSRTWISAAIASHRGRAPMSDKVVPYVDPW
jgi:acetyl/propionyl-CoA carboxylase alpha subunit/acetyl-CoA carboxylase carboxyltransferase component